MLKKLSVLIAALAVSAPAFADHGHRDYRQGYRAAYQDRYVHHRPVVHDYRYRPYYRPAPVVVYQQPRPVYVVERPHYNGAALLVGAVLGAAIVHHAITGY